MSRCGVDSRGTALSQKGKGCCHRGTPQSSRGPASCDSILDTTCLGGDIWRQQGPRLWRPGRTGLPAAVGRASSQVTMGVHTLKYTEHH